jgi:hypothetical protein
MTRAPHLLWAILVALVLTSASRAAQPRRTVAPIELPPMMVEESVSSVPWLYVNAEGTEFLSRCSAFTTRRLAEAWLRKQQLLRVLVPEEFLGAVDVPSLFVLYAQDLEQTVSAEIQRELRERDGASGTREGVNIALSMRLSDRDMHASIAYIDEALFEADGLSIAPGHVRFMLTSRVPELPGWLIDGIERVYRRTDFVMEPVSFRPLVWINDTQSSGLSSDALRPRAILPASELFANEAARVVETAYPQRADVRAATQELFFRWAVLSGSATRDALRRFATRAAVEPVTEEMFVAEFGFDFSELRDRLSDYLPRAVEEYTRLAPGKLPPLPLIDVRRATPNEIARVRGEWERLAIAHVQRRLPEVRDPYLAQARRTLRRAYDAGDRDPRLLATMGLCEIDAGNEAGARTYLEPAVATGVVRPRAHYELARLRFRELTRAAPATKLFSFTELAKIIEPLRTSLGQSPPLAEAFGLLAEAWSRCESPPTDAEFAELERGAQLYGRRPEVAYPIALAFAHHGRRPAALTVLDRCGTHAADDETRARIARLRAELMDTPRAPGP